jgi:hypothetical protein
MDSIKSSENIMFLFGAGISIPIGIPGMKGIFDSYVSNRKSGITAKSRKICDLFTKTMGLPNDLEEILLAANAIIEFRESNLNKFIEKNISRKLTSSRIAEYNRNFDDNFEGVTEFKNGILDFLSNTCYRFDREKTLKINSGFVETLSKVGYPVYSTNYDFAFEHVALEKGIKIIDNFKRIGQRFIWNDKIDFEGDNGFKLIKLHGSVTWYTDGKGTIEKIHSKTTINPLGKEVENIVIIPTRFKDIYNQHFFALYSRFLSSLAQSKVIIIAGHSLRDDYLRARIIERKRKGDFQIIIVDPSFPEIAKQELPPSRLGTLGNVIHIPFKWEEFADELSNILQTSTYDQVAKKCTDIFNKQKFQKNKVILKGNIGTFTALQPKSIVVETKAFLTITNRPSNLRVWLETSYTDPDGSAQVRITNDFLEEVPIQFGNNLTGLVDSSNKIKIKIPKYSKWAETGSKVILKIGLINSNILKPINVKDNAAIALIQKQIDYKVLT